MAGDFVGPTWFIDPLQDLVQQKSPIDFNKNFNSTPGNPATHLDPMGLTGLDEVFVI